VLVKLAGLWFILRRNNMDYAQAKKMLELLQAILDKLEEVRCGLIDVENAVEKLPREQR